MAKLKKQKIPAKYVKHKKEPDWPYDYDIHGMPLDPNHPCYKPPRPGNRYLKYPKWLLLSRDEVPEVMVSSWPYRLDLKIDAYLTTNTKDPLMALECLMLCHKEGVYPPAELMQFLNNGIERYWNERGKVPLETCLDVEAKMFSHFFEKRRHKRLEKYYDYWLKVWAWQQVFDVSEVQAKRLVCSLPSMITESPKLERDYVRRLKKNSEWVAIQAETKEDFSSLYLDAMRDDRSRQVEFVSAHSLTLIKKLQLPLWIHQLHREYQNEP